MYVFFTIGNVESEHRSAFRHIHLLSIFFNHQVVAYGLNTLIRPIIDELKQLEDGVKIIIKKEARIIFGTVTILTADNLASHAIGGFKMGFSRGFRKCRYCMATDEQIQTKFSDSDFLPRTANDHNLQCAGLKTKMAKHFGWLYGLTGSSILNELKFFHVINGLVPDVMHDILEGCLPLTICEVLNYYIFKKNCCPWRFSIMHCKILIMDALKLKTNLLK